MSVTRKKFTTTLDAKVIKKLGILRAINENKGINEVIEELVNEKYEEIELNDKNNKKR